MVNLRLGGIAVAERAGLSGLNAVPSSMTYHGGRLLTHVRVKPIFWGPQWLTLGHPAVPPAAIVWTIRTILFSPYMSALSQYGGIQSGPSSLSGWPLLTRDRPMALPVWSSSRC